MREWTWQRLRRLAKHTLGPPYCNRWRTLESIYAMTRMDCLHGPLPGPFSLSYSVFIFIFSLFFSFLGPCARLSWPSRQLLSARYSTVSYRIVWRTLTIYTRLKNRLRNLMNFIKVIHERNNHNRMYRCYVGRTRTACVRILFRFWRRFRLNSAF